ncbi:inovirus Gp2 family protein [uncultured Amphritea sp.]|uniref:inovirus Gp2 family protein n=1 Tax=uncultured Amphritea sp. TaxID=981605 RepID=UPI00261F1A23|nr:inovirus Gp2 family protein [uncultured Amphritea sp.]
MINKRVPENPNLNVWTQSSYQGLPVNTAHELVEQYLHKLKTVIDLSTQDYRSVFAVIVQLHCVYPTQDLADSNRVLGRFKDAIDSRIESYQKRSPRGGLTRDLCRVRMAWGREQSRSQVPHFHVVLLFNRELFYHLGSFNSGKGSLFQIIQGAWRSALNIPPERGSGLVQVPSNPEYYLNHSDSYMQLPSFFRRASYLCKVDTKCFGQKLQSFGGSRK